MKFEGVMTISSRALSVGVLTLLVAVVLVGLVGCVAAAEGASVGAGGAAGYALANGGKSLGEVIDDSLITTRVKSELCRSPVVSGHNIDGDVTLGVVYLSGVGMTEHEMVEAARLARTVVEVRDVHSS